MLTDISYIVISIIVKTIAAVLTLSLSVKVGSFNRISIFQFEYLQHVYNDVSRLSFY